MPGSQHEYWNDPDVAADVRAGTSGVTHFAELVAARLPDESLVLELGCGAGDDAAFFSALGHNVIAIDVSEPLIDLASQRFADRPNLVFSRADISHALPVAGQSCHSVYARLSLHYFDHETTLGIMSEVMWVLRSGAQFHFSCRSTEDPRYGKGTEVGPDMFELDGHVRHFFSPAYAMELLEDAGFSRYEVHPEVTKLYGETSAVIRCAAIKP